MGIFFLLLFFGLAFCPVVFANGEEFSVPTWSQLHFEASQALQQISTEVSLMPVSDPRLIEGTMSDPIQAASDSILLATAKVRAKLLFKTKKWTGRVWFDGVSGAVLQRVRLKPGDDASRKSFRFGQKGVERFVDRPRSRDEADLSPDAWSKTKRHYFPYPMPSSGCDVVSDPLLLLVSASSLDIDKDTSKRICVFNKKTLYYVELKAEKREELQTAYVLKMKERQVKTESPVTAIKVRISAKPIDPKAPSRDDFEFLGLGGQLFLWVDAERRIPLIVTGELSPVGQVSIGLTAATLP